MRTSVCASQRVSALTHAGGLREVVGEGRQPALRAAHVLTAVRVARHQTVVARRPALVDEVVMTTLEHTALNVRCPVAEKL